MPARGECDLCGESNGHRLTNTKTYEGRRVVRCTRPVGVPEAAACRSDPTAEEGVRMTEHVYDETYDDLRRYHNDPAGYVAHCSCGALVPFDPDEPGFEHYNAERAVDAHAAQQRIAVLPVVTFAHVDLESGITLATFDTAEQAQDALRLVGPLAQVEVDAIFGDGAS